MIIDRCTRPANLSQPIVGGPILQGLDWILDYPYLCALLRRDMAKHYKASGKGRPPVPAGVTPRMIVLRRPKKSLYRQAKQEVRDNECYRWWVRACSEPVRDQLSLGLTISATYDAQLGCKTTENQYRLAKYHRSSPERIPPSLHELVEG